MENLSYPPAQSKSLLDENGDFSGGRNRCFSA